jgi:hypothetical protein
MRHSAPAKVQGKTQAAMSTAAVVVVVVADVE